MGLQYYKLYFVEHTCGHTVPLKSLSGLTRQEIYQRAGGLCSRCQRLQQDADNAAPAADPARVMDSHKKTRAVYKRYETAYRDLCPMYPGGRVPVGALASHLGIGTNSVYKWLRSYASVTDLRAQNGEILRKGE